MKTCCSSYLFPEEKIIMKKIKENKVSSDTLEQEIKALIEALRKSGTICGTGEEISEIQKQRLNKKSR